MEPSESHHNVFVTMHTEYHVLEGLCVAVRDRATGRWQPQHYAIGLRLQGGLRVRPGGGLETHEQAQPGDRLCFAQLGERSLLTSDLVAVVALGRRTSPIEAPEGLREKTRPWAAPSVVVVESISGSHART